jgi:hypothetical protein
MIKGPHPTARQVELERAWRDTEVARLRALAASKPESALIARMLATALGRSGQ